MLSTALPARAATYSYVDWLEADVAAGTAKGTITLPDSSTVDVTFAAINEDLTPGSLYSAQVSGGTNFWNPSAPFISTQVENAPPTPDILQLSGGLNQTYRVTLSEPIKDPIMALVSLGAPGTHCTYDFDSPFAIVSQGVGYWGGGADKLQALPNDVLDGEEGHGTIQFIGTFSTFSWTVPTPETWHGFTFGIRTTERLEPTPEGGAGGMGGAAPTSEGGTANGGSPAADAGAAPQEGLAGFGEGGAGPATGGSGAGGSTHGSVGGGGAATEAPEGGASASEGGSADEDGRAVTRESGGCNCGVAGGSAGVGVSGLLVVGLSLLARQRRRGRRSADEARSARH